jgi:DNA-directed RNA polymerase specialized sigma subunit
MGTIVVKLKEYRKNRSRDMFQEIRDYLKDKREEEIITLRLEGYNDVEIAEKIGLTKMRISQIRREIGKRIDKNDLLRTRRN